MRILVRGPVDTVSGYGNDVVGLLTELRNVTDVSVWPLSVTPPVPRVVAQLFERELKPPYDAVLWYTDPAALTPWDMQGWGRVQVGWSMWERTPLTGRDLPWWDEELTYHRDRRVWSDRYDIDRSSWLDELWVPCRMNVEAFAALDKVTPIGVVTPGVNEKQWPVLPRNRSDDVVRFCAEGVLAGRKDPASLLRAWSLFREARPELVAELHLKLTGAPEAAFRARGVPDVVLHTDVWPQSELLRFYDQMDCMVSASRGEGVNKPAVQFLCTGGPVIASRWGGHEAWLMDSHAWAVDHTVQESPAEAGTYDAPVDVEHLAQLFATVSEDPAGRRRKGAAGAGFVRSALSWPVVVPKVLSRLSRLM